MRPGRGILKSDDILAKDNCFNVLTSSWKRFTVFRSSALCQASSFVRIRRKRAQRGRRREF